MPIKQIIADVSIGLISGDVGTKVMEPVSMKDITHHAQDPRYQ